MALSASREPAAQKRTLSSLLDGRVVKRPRQEDAVRLQEAALQLLEQHLDLQGLLREAGNTHLGNAFRSQNGEQKQAATEGATSAAAGSLLACELRRRASQLGVPAAALSVKMALERLTEITGSEEEEDQRRGLLSSSQRVQLGVLLQSCRELLSQGALCPKLLWQEYRRDQRRPDLEVVYQLHAHNILTLKAIIESDEEAGLWLVSGLKALCGWTAPQGGEEAGRAQQEVLSAVVGVLVGGGFELSPEAAAASRAAPLCRSALDAMLSWLLDAVEERPAPRGAAQAAALWIQTFDASLCGVSASGDALQRFFTHCLTQTLTHRPRLTVSDAVALQKDWTFAKADRLLTSLFRKLAVAFGVEQLLRLLQRVLETREVNWRHVLCFLSTLLVYNPGAQRSLSELLSRLLSSAFEGYDLESMITAFLLARQGALEGAAVFPSYSSWFKMSFGGSSGFHVSSKKSLVFLLKFLSDLVPFEPSQYLKVHVLQPPYVQVKHRSLLMEYVSLAKTRLADLKESVEDMGLYEDVSAAGGAALQPQCQAVQDVEKAVSLFETTGRISATVMEASIFRRPYFLSRFLSALLTARTLPVKADARMSFIEALKKADKIPAAQYSSYVESCQKQRQQHGAAVCLDTSDEPLEVLKLQLQEFTQLLQGDEGEMSAQLSRLSHTLSAIFPGRPDEPTGRTVIELHTSGPPAPELHVQAVGVVLRIFCQCVLDASRANPPNKQSPWASMFVGALLGNRQLLSGLLHRLWDLFHNQAAALSGAHLLGLAALLVHLHAGSSRGPLVRLVPPPTPPPDPVGVAEALGSALVCSTAADMRFCVRLCVSAVCYGICRGDALPPEQQQDFVPHGLYKKLLYLIPRLSPEARGAAAEGPTGDQREQNPPGLWSSATDASGTWRKTAGHLWRHPAFRRLELAPAYQLSLSEWLDAELRVLRQEDALSDPERQEYQLWACWELYLPRPAQQGGCGGDTRALCSHLLDAVMDQQRSSQQNPEKLHHTGTGLPDLLTRLQELVYDEEVSVLSSSRGSLCDFLLESLCQRCSSSSSSSSAAPSISSELNLQHTLTAWNRVLLALPAVLLVKVSPAGGRAALQCDALIEHVNQHQRKACSPAGLLSCQLTSHLLRGLLGAAARCTRPGEEVNNAWSQISRRCPLLLVSTAHWWQRVCPVLASLWRRQCDGQRLPERLQLLSGCQDWACSLEKEPSSPPPPGAGALLLAASLHRAWGGGAWGGGAWGGGAWGGGVHEEQRFAAALDALQPESSALHRQVLVFLLFLCVQDHLASLLDPQRRRRRAASALCSDLLGALAASPDWLLVFQSHERGVYQPLAAVASDAWPRLMPWAFYSLLLLQSAERLQRAASCPGFIGTAVPCYLGLLQLHLEGPAAPPPHLEGPAAPPPHLEGPAAPPPHQMESSQLLIGAKQFLLRAIAQTPPSALSSSRRRQLEAQCADLDPEVAAALSMHLDPHSLSPEMDFL